MNTYNSKHNDLICIYQKFVWKQISWKNFLMTLNVHYLQSKKELLAVLISKYLHKLYIFHFPPPLKK